MDATTRTKAEQEFDIAALCRPVAEASPIPMAAVGGDSHIVLYVNPAFCRLVGKSKDELVEKDFSRVVPPGNEFLSLLDHVYRTGRAEIHIGQENSPSHPFYWSYAIWPAIADDGHVAGIVIQVTETTPFHEQSTAMNQALMLGSLRQHELREEAIEALQRSNEELRRANADLKQFSFAASHDLREPLRMINIYSQLLVESYRGQLEDQASMWVEFITNGTHRMEQLLTDLLAYTTTTEEATDPGESADLNLVLQKVEANLNAAIDESHTAIEFSHLPVIHGHAAHFELLFQNLIANAIKYRDKNPPCIHIFAEERGGEWRFAVADNGIGIDPEYHKQVFGVFKRLHTKAIPGTGIGLAICQRVVERYGGHIWVESKVGNGATFYFTLPA